MNARSWNYLRVRGEYSSNRRAIFKSRELPPRARRILHSVDAVPLNIGTTSACAENTSACYPRGGRFGNYLRVRGEYSILPIYSVGCTELPPRARRIHTPSEMVRLESGTTSACAENTASESFATSTIWNYLRVRGEYPPRYHPRSANQELPPRARRIRWSERQKGNHHGTTSACAENTGWWGAHQHIDGNYLRVRGEYIENYQAMRDKTELPPRARRIQDRPDYFDWIIGTTSACAENTSHF